MNPISKTQPQGAVNMIMTQIGDWFVYAAVSALACFVRLLPKRAAMIIGCLTGWVFYRGLKKRRRIALNNLRIAFGNGLLDRQRREICRASFINAGKTAVEFLRFPQFTCDTIWRDVTVDGKDHLFRALSQGRGVVVFLAHFGNWELLSLVFGALIPDRAKALAFPLKNRWLNALVWRYRQHLGLKLIPRKQAVKETLRALKNNCAVGFFADQNAGREGVFVDFFRTSVSSVRGPVTFALRTGAPLLFSLDIRQPNDGHHVHISAPFPLKSSGDFERDVQINTARLIHYLEGYIRRHPAQWLWFHDRWKTRPEPSWQRKREKRRHVLNRSKT